MWACPIVQNGITIQPTDARLIVVGVTMSCNIIPGIERRMPEWKMGTCLESGGGGSACSVVGKHTQLLS